MKVGTRASAASLAVLTIVAAACSSGSTPSASAAAASAPASASASQVAVASPSTSGKKLKLCASQATNSNPFSAAEATGFKDEAAALGADYSSAIADEDANKQLQQITDMITAGCDGIVVVASSAKAIGDGIRGLNAKIPIITADRTVDPPYGGMGGANPVLHVGWSDPKLGEITAQLVVKACEGKDPCNLIIEQGTLGSTPEIARTKAVQAAVAAHPNIKLLDMQPNNFDPGVATTLTESLIAKYPKIDVITTYNDAASLAVISVLKQNNRFDGVKVIGNGGSKAGTESIAAGEMFGTAWVSPSGAAKVAFQALADLIKGKTPANMATVDGLPTAVYDVVEVTKDNVAQYPGDW